MTAPRVLVGGEYLDAAANLRVRVLDSKRSRRSGALSFIVEAADDARPGQRWIRPEAQLVELRAASGEGALGTPRALVDRADARSLQAGNEQRRDELVEAVRAPDGRGGEGGAQ